MARASELSEDILFALFELFAELDAPTTRSLGWVRMTHVCRSWRTVGLDHSLLWARVFGAFACREAVEVVRARARGLPLKLVVPERLSKKHEDTLADAVATGFQGIQTLSLRRFSQSWTKLVAKALVLPDTRELVIDDVPPANLALIQSIHHFHQLHVSTERVYAPQLESMHLRGGVLVPLVAPNLKTLVISEQSTTAWMLLDLFEGCPRLENVTIDYSFVGNRMPPIHGHDIVELPHLRSFKLLVHPWLRSFFRREILEMRRKVIMPAEVELDVVEHVEHGPWFDGIPMPNVMPGGPAHAHQELHMLAAPTFAMPLF